VLAVARSVCLSNALLRSDTYKASNTNLSTRVAELRKGSMEQAVLLPKGLDIGT
jgi:hypothetical protein